MEKLLGPGPARMTLALGFETSPTAIVPRIPMVPTGSLTVMLEGSLRATLPVTKRKTPLVTLAVTFPALVAGS